MEVSFRTRRLARVFSSDRELRKEFGDAAAKVIMGRLRVLLRVPNLSHVPTFLPCEDIGYQALEKGNML